MRNLFNLSTPFKTRVLAVAIAMSLNGCGGGSSSTPSDEGSVNPEVERHFNRVASFAVCSQIEANCNTDDETAAEIVAASSDGMMLVYTDSPNESIGFVNITDSSAPLAAGTLALTGEPTSVAIKGDYALVGVNTSADFINTSGQLDIVDVATKTIVHSLDLGGQPDAVSISPDGRYAAIAIENERDEDLGEGVPPQAPAGFLVIVDMVGEPSAWTTRTVTMTGLADLYAGDPEPEYVDINTDNVAVVTLQENNHIVLVNLVDGSIVNDFSAGTVDLTEIDTKEEDPAIISLSDTQDARPREPDGVTWISTELFATADEGDLDGGSRGFTIFNTQGDVVYSSANTLDHEAVRLGHYPDDRSKNKGNEPENADYAEFGDDKYLFVASERSSLVFVYDMSDSNNPILKQTLPAGAGPEGVLALPSRNIMVAASEVDDRGDKLRSVINIYNYEEKDASYPTISSENGSEGLPIAWGALSGLAAGDDNTLYAIEDSFYQQNRIFTLDVSSTPAKLTNATTIKDSNDVFASMQTTTVAAGLDDDDDARKEVFDQLDLEAMINDDKTVNIDPEGIAVADDGGFWIASEGSGTLSDSDDRPLNSLNMIFKTDQNGVIENVITLPDAINATQVRFGFEGVAEYQLKLYVAQQRAWAPETNPKIFVYDIVTRAWSSFDYPLESATSQNGGWVGLSDITSLGNGRFLVVERDNQAGPDATIKRLYSVDLTGLADGATVTKTLVRDVIPDLKATGALIHEKIEGAAVLSNGDVYIVNDNDGVDDNSGETQLLNLGDIL